MFWNPDVFRSDPVTHSDETGNFFYLSLLWGQFLRRCMALDQWRPIVAAGRPMGMEVIRNGSPSTRPAGPGHGFQYQFWTGFFACDTGEFNRSTDGGITWMTPINVPNDTDTGALDVDTNGNLFLGG